MGFTYGGHWKQVAAGALGPSDDTSVLNMPGGLVSAVSYGFAGDPNSGIYQANVNNIDFSGNGLSIVRMSSGVLRLQNAMEFGWSSGNPTLSTSDLTLFRGAADILEQRRGTNAQAFRVYNTTDGAGNTEYGQMLWSGGVLYIGAAVAGTGTTRSVQILAPGSQSVGFRTNANLRFVVDANGHVKAQSDNSYDDGANEANRKRNIFVGGYIEVGSTPADSGAIRLGYGNHIYNRNSDDTNNVQMLSIQTVNSVPNVIRLGAGTSAGALFDARSGSGAPSTSDIPDGEACVWKRTGGPADVNLYYNDGGSLVSVTLT